MSVYPCPECTPDPAYTCQTGVKTYVSESALFCPHCGWKVERRALVTDNRYVKAAKAYKLERIKENAYREETERLRVLDQKEKEKERYLQQIKKERNEKIKENVAQFFLLIIMLIIGIALGCLVLIGPHLMATRG